MTSPIAHAPAPALHLLVRELRLARLRLGLTTDALGHTLNVTDQEVAAWEASRGQLDLHTIAGWSAALGYRLSLQPGRGPRILREADGAPAVPDLGRGLLVYGPERFTVWAAIEDELPGVPVTGSWVAKRPRTLLADVAEDLRHAVRAARDGKPRDMGLLLVNVPGLPVSEYPALAECLSLYRAAGWVALVIADDETTEIPGREHLDTLLFAQANDRVRARLASGEERTWHIA